MPEVVGYCRVSTDGQTLDAQVAELKAAGAAKLFAEKQSGARSDRPQLRRALAALGEGDVLMVSRLWGASPESRLGSKFPARSKGIPSALSVAFSAWSNDPEIAGRPQLYSMKLTTEAWLARLWST